MKEIFAIIFVLILFSNREFQTFISFFPLRILESSLVCMHIRKWDALQIALRYFNHLHYYSKESLANVTQYSSR